MAQSSPKTPPRPSVFPTALSMTYPAVSWVARPSSLKVTLLAWGGEYTVLPVGSIPISGPVCVPTARDENHTRLPSKGST